MQRAHQRPDRDGDHPPAGKRSGSRHPPRLCEPTARLSRLPTPLTHPAPPRTSPPPAQKTCAELVPTAQRLLREHGSKVFTRGLPPCMAREAIYTAGYLGSTPVVKEHLMNLSVRFPRALVFRSSTRPVDYFARAVFFIHSDTVAARAAAASLRIGLAPPPADSNPPPQVFEGQPNAALLAGGIVSGVVASVLTQPLDTVKTRMQARQGPPAAAAAAGAHATGLLRASSSGDECFKGQPGTPSLPRVCRVSATAGESRGCERAVLNVRFGGQDAHVRSPARRLCISIHFFLEHQFSNRALTPHPPNPAAPRAACRASGRGSSLAGSG